jgi:hypothetical protein
MTESEEHDLPDISNTSFDQRFEYQVGSGKESKGIFKKIEKSILQRENRKEEPSVNKEKLAQRLHQRTKRGQQAKTELLQSDLLEGKVDHLKDMMNGKLQGGKARLPNKLKSLLTTMGEMKEELRAAKEAVSPQKEAVLPREVATETKVKPLKARPVLDIEAENEAVLKKSKNQRKREKAKAKRKLSIQTQSHVSMS